MVYGSQHINKVESDLKLILIKIIYKIMYF